MRRIIVETITIIPLVRLFKDRTQDLDTKAFKEGLDYSFVMESKLIYQKIAILISLLTVLLFLGNKTVYENVYNLCNLLIYAYFAEHR